MLITQLLVSLAWLVAGSNPAVDESIDFDSQIVPVLTKSGCNAGACHGAAAGRGDFRLSLLGSRPQFDYDSIVREFEGRRVNHRDAEDSLVVLKPSGVVPHGGNVRLDSSGLKLLLTWIRQGAPRIRRDSIVDVELVPSTVSVESGATIDVKAFADLEDGTRRDVTSWVLFRAVDSEAVEFDKTEVRITARRPGRHVVIARYLDFVKPVTVLVPYSPSKNSVAVQNPKSNWIDDHVNRSLEELRIPLSGQVDDAEFRRRVTLSLTGTLPDFRSEPPSGSKSSVLDRGALIDQLLGSQEFVDYWSFRLSELFQIRSQGEDRQSAIAFHGWLQTQLRESTGWDTMMNSLLTASGDSHTNGEANFFRMASDSRSQAEYVSRVFMGVRLQCANCHDHPLDRWTQDDYHGLAALFAPMERGRVIRFRNRGEVIHPVTGEAAIPRLPGEKFLEPGVDHRAELSDWLSSDKNRFFAPAIVNRLWKAMMGRGLVEPVDDLRATNPATHPELLEQLADEFRSSGGDIRSTLKVIALSSAFARSSRASAGNSGDDRFYSHWYAHPLAPEVLSDAIDAVTGVATGFGNNPDPLKIVRAIQLPDSRINAPSLDVLGRCSREQSCESSASTSGLTTRLHLINGGLLNDKISDPNGRLASLLKLEDQEVLDKLYRLALSRSPTESEKRYWLREIGSGQQRAAVIEDWLWSILNCREFVTNH